MISVEELKSNWRLETLELKLNSLFLKFSPSEESELEIKWVL